MLNSTLNPILQTAIADVYDRLNTFVEDPLFTTNLVSIFGQNAPAITPKQFLNFVHHLPTVNSLVAKIIDQGYNPKILGNNVTWENGGDSISRIVVRL